NIHLNDLAVRYYFTKDSDAQLQFNCYYAQIGAENINHSFGTYSSGSYLELTFSGGTVAAGNQSGEIQFAINKSDWSLFQQKGDYSFDATKTSFQEHNKITLYQNEIKVYGIEPDGGPVLIQPQVSITAPADGTDVLPHQPVTLNANATDSDGQVTEVEFFVNSQSIETDIASPYSAVWTPATEGTYTIKVVAKDNDGIESLPAEITINVKAESNTGFIIPGNFEAEDYDTYYDLTPGNTGGVYRNDDVDIEVCGEGGYNVGWIDSGEWLAYPISVASDGMYDIELRVARETSGDGSLHIEIDNQDVTGAMTIPSTNGWQTYTTISKTAVNLTQGNHILKIVMDQGPFNINWINVLESNVTLYPLTISIAADTTDTQTVVLEPAPSHSGNAMISGTNGYSETVYYQEINDITLTASINDQVEFISWSGSLNSTVNPSTYLLNSSGDITAHFQKIVLEQIPLTIQINGTGSVALTPGPTQSGNQVITSTTTVYYSDPINISLQASDDFNYWSGAVSGNQNPEQLNLSEYKEYNVTASFNSPITSDWLHTEGNKIVDENGNPVWLTGANWFGFNTGTNAFDGLWSCNLEQALNAMADRGINLLRIPISTQLLNEWKNGIYPIPSSINYYVNPGLEGKTSLEIFDITVAHCESIGMKIMLDVHSPGSDAMGHIDPLWYKGSITPEIFIQTWQWFAERYKNNDTIIAYDLENEPHGKPYQSADAARWDNSDHINNWKKTAEDCANAILAINPNVLIVVEGIESYPKEGKDYSSSTENDYYNNWWGGNLRGVKDYPLDLGTNQDQLVYSPHDYGPLVYQQPWFQKDFNQQTLYEDCWGPNWAYIMEENIAPLLIGEWGGFMDGSDNQKWMEALRDYIKENFIHQTFWCFNANSGDTGGLVESDFVTWDEEKYQLLKPALWQDRDGKFVGLDHDTPLGSNGITLTDYYQNGNTPPVR
ncbi:MAG: cellulase family glycosylhydrolase, partial [Spirochaetes bacterium]|nr:cellulase family glycosylhydrolase [Spirochaetota bacterium]